jgi:hypothetical protein
MVASVPVYETKGIGDINSREKGSGARYNSGKPAMELIPVWIGNIDRPLTAN